MRARHPHLSLGRRVALRTLASYLITCVLLHMITAIIQYEIFPNGPFHVVITKSGLRIRHLFWGILLLMATGFGAFASRSPQWYLRIALVFGIALANIYAATVPERRSALAARGRSCTCRIRAGTP